MYNARRTTAKWVKVFCLPLFILPIVSGCWDGLEIDQRAVVLGIGIDLAEPAEREEEPEVNHLQGTLSISEKEMIKLTAQIAVPGRIPLGPQTGGGGEDQKPVWVVEAIGHTLGDALLNLQQEVAEELFLGHLRMIIIHEEVAKKGITNFYDHLRRNQQIRRTAWLLISKDKAAKLLNIAPPLEQVPTLYLQSMIENAVELGKLPNDFISLFWTRYSNKGEEAFLPYVSIKHKENIQISGLAYFKGDTMVGVTKPIEIGTFMAVKGVKQGGYALLVKVPGTSDNVLIRALNRRTKWEVDLKEGKPYFRVLIHYETELDEKSSPKIQVADNQTLEKIEQAFSQQVKEGTKKLIEKTQKDEADIFGFGEYVRAKKPTYWNKHIQTNREWQKMYKDMTVEVEVSNKIRRTGLEVK